MLTDKNYANIAALMAELDNPAPTPRHYISTEDDSKEKNENGQICSQCGGYCCNKCGCHFSPYDFKEITFEYLKKEMEKGHISIDSVDGECIYRRTDVLILRARNQDAPVVDLGYHRSPCILLTDTGCKLDYSHRPAGGRLLIPRVDLKDGKIVRLRCPSKYSIEDCCREWLPYQPVLRGLKQYFEGKDIPCSI